MLKHKRNIKLLGFTLLLPWLMGSCADDKFDSPDLWEELNAEMPEGEYIISFDLQWEGGASSRADGTLEDGSHEDHQLRDNGLYAFFFSDTDELLKVVPMLTSHYDKEGNEFTEEKIAEGKYFSTYKVKGNEFKPDKCLVMINASNELIQKYLDTKIAYTLYDVMHETWDDAADARRIGHSSEDGSFTISNYDYLTMTNASYIDDKGELQCAVPVSIENNFVRAEWFGNFDPYQSWDGVTLTYIDDEDEWKEKTINLWEKVLTIPVERMLAKFSFSIEPDDDAVYEPHEMIFTPANNKMIVFTEIDDDGNLHYDTSSYYYKVKFTGWGINALETEEYLYKQFDKDAFYFSNWTDPDRLRTYWAVDNHYNVAENYPVQYRRAFNDSSIKYYYEKEEEANKNMLRNYPYEALCNNLKMELYAPENTYDNSNNYNKWLTDYDEERLHNLIGSHVIVCAELVTNIPNPKYGEEGEPQFLKDLYRDRNGIWYKSELDYFKAMIQILQNDFKSQSEIHYVYHNWGEDVLKDPGYSEPTDDKTLLTINVGKEWVENYDDGATIHTSTGEWFLYYKKGEEDERVTIDKAEEIYNYLKSVTEEANVSKGDGQRMLWYDNLSIKDKDKNPLQRCSMGIYVTEKNAAGQNIQVLKTINNRGKTIKQNLGPLDNNHRKSLIYEWLGAVDHFNNGALYYAAPIENVKFSDGNKNYGVIRNTFYKFTLGNINSLGTSVDNLSEAIVPNSKKDFNQLTFHVDVIGWHDFEVDAPWPN